MCVALQATHMLTSPPSSSIRTVETRKKAISRIEEQLMRMEVQATDREENKQIALGTSKLNYLDPRISVAWYDPLHHNIEMTPSSMLGCTESQSSDGSKL